MKCPFCANDMRYRERSDRTCTKCKKKFALEPKSDAYSLHDARLKKLADKLSDGGKLRVLDDNLRHFLARKTSGASSGGSGCAAVAVCIGLLLFGTPILAEFFDVVHVLAVLVPLLVLAIVYAWTRPEKPFPRSDLKTLGALCNSLRTYREVHGALPPGLMTGDEAARLPEPRVPPGPMHAVVISPSQLVIETLRINGVAARFGVGLLAIAGPGGPDRQQILQRLRDRPGLPILLFHDASPEGCLLAEDLPGMFGLKPDHRIVDMGLFPRRSIAKKRLCLGAPVDAAALARLRGRAALPPPAEPARARPLRPRRAALTATELEWLASGRTTPIEALMPRDLIQRVTAACTRLARSESSEQVAVRQFGFMTRPRPAEQRP